MKNVHILYNIIIGLPYRLASLLMYSVRVQCCTFEKSRRFFVMSLTAELSRRFFVMSLIAELSRRFFVMSLTAELSRRFFVMSLTAELSRRFFVMSLTAELSLLLKFFPPGLADRSSNSSNTYV